MLEIFVGDLLLHLNCLCCWNIKSYLMSVQLIKKSKIMVSFVSWKTFNQTYIHTNQIHHFSWTCFLTRCVIWLPEQNPPGLVCVIVWPSFDAVIENRLIWFEFHNWLWGVAGCKYYYQTITFPVVRFEATSLNIFSHLWNVIKSDAWETGKQWSSQRYWWKYTM